MFCLLSSHNKVRVMLSSEYFMLTDRIYSIYNSEKSEETFNGFYFSPKSFTLFPINLSFISSHNSGRKPLRYFE